MKIDVTLTVINRDMITVSVTSIIQPLPGRPDGRRLAAYRLASEVTRPGQEPAWPCCREGMTGRRLAAYG
jgi:hypothetical protein